MAFEQENIKKRNYRPIVYISILLAVVLISVFILLNYLGLSNKNTPNQPAVNNISENNSMQVYRDPDYYYEFQYPSSYTVMPRINELTGVNEDVYILKNNDTKATHDTNDMYYGLRFSGLISQPGGFMDGLSDDSGWQIVLGMWRYKNKDWDKAILAFERAIEISPQETVAQYMLGLSYNKADRKADAIKQFEKVQIDNPDNTDIKTILVRLRAGEDLLLNMTDIVINKNPIYKDPPWFIKNYKNYEDKKRVSINGIEAYRYISVDTDGVYKKAFFSKDNNEDGVSASYIFIGVNGQGLEDYKISPIDEAVFESIVNSFRFIEPKRDAKIGEWKILQNKKYGFEMKYPQDLILVIEPAEEDISFSTDIFFLKKQEGFGGDSVVSIFPSSSGTTSPINKLFIDEWIAAQKNNPEVEFISGDTMEVNGLHIKYVVVKPIVPPQYKKGTQELVYMAYILNKDSTKMFLITGPELPETLSLEDFLLILSTFRLTE